MVNKEELNETLSMRDKFAEKRHKEKKEIVNLKLDCACKLIDKRDKYAEKRHKERMQIIVNKL